MERPLLGDSSGHRPRFRHRTQAITRGSSYQRAAALVDLAEDGIGLPEEILESSDFDKAAKLYFSYIQFDVVWMLNYFALIVLNFLEKPLWCGSSLCSDREYYYLGQLPYLSNTKSLIYEVVTIIILAVHIFFPISYEGVSIYWKNNVNKLKVTCFLVLLADLVVYILYLAPLAFSSLPFRVAPYVRVIFFILSIRDLRKCIVVVAGMLITYLNVLALLLLFLLFSSWVVYVMFEDTNQGKTYFTSYGATLFQMFILFTTSNNPDVWIPAYKISRWYCLVFVLYILVGVYFVTNLILAVIYDSFKIQLVKQVFSMDQMRSTILMKAFNLLDHDNVGVLNKEQCIRLFEELNNYRTLPKISREEFQLIFENLDDSGDFKINLDEFSDLCNAIGLRFQKEDVPSYFEYFPSIYKSPFSEKLKNFVRSPMFSYGVSVILLMNLVTVVIETTLDIENSSSQATWQLFEFIFGWVYVVEMALKVYSYGLWNYWRVGENRFDFVVTWVIVIGETLTFVAPNGLTFLSNGEWIRYLLIARILRLIRILLNIKNYRAFVATFLTLLPTLMPYLGVIFCVLCFYCSLGVQIFGGIVNEGNSSLEGTDMYDSDYLLFNFNDYPSGMVTLFNLLFMNNWQTWMQSYKDLTGTSWTLIYFISFYLISVLLFLNLVIAFVLEAFFAEMDLETQDKDGEGERSRKQMERSRTIGIKSRSQRIDILLHHMLKDELVESQATS